MSSTPVIDSLFVTRIYRTDLGAEVGPDLNSDLEATCLGIAMDDRAGQRWCDRNDYPGYTSYASLDDLPKRATAFASLKRHLDRHVAAFAKVLELDLRGKKLVLDSLWINVLAPGGTHSGHIHPHSAISGTYYVTIPPGASAIKFEDPRLGLMMAAPPRKAKAARDNRQFIYAEPTPGTLLLWESWLRHEVPLNMADEDRISVSFNYSWG